MVAPVRFIESQTHVASRRGHSYVLPQKGQNESIDFEDEINQTYDSGDDRRVTAIADGKGLEEYCKYSADVQRDNNNKNNVTGTKTGQEYESEFKAKENSSKFIILPHSKFRSSWDVFVGILLLYVVCF